MKNFAAIDFETANGNRSSVCSVGVVIVKDGKIVDNYYSLIKPEPNYYNEINTSIHGLDASDTNNAPTFDKVWKELSPKIEGMTLVAHNKAFDESCLKAICKIHKIDCDKQFRCTYQASRRYFGNKLPNHRLDTVASACGFDMNNHHHALADAEACAYIAMKIIDDED